MSHAHHQETSAAGLPLPSNWLAAIIFIWSGQAVSMITSYAAGYALVWYVTESTGSALMLAAMNVLAFLPIGLISPFGGVVADRVNRKAIMIVADLSIGIVSLVCGLVVMAGDASLMLVGIICVLRSTGQSFHSPAMMASMPLLVPERHLLRVNTLDQALASVAAIGAPAFGIFIYTVLGLEWALILDFAGALVAVLGLSCAKIPTIRDEGAVKESVLANLRDGLRAIGARRGLALVVVGVGLVSLAYAPLSAIFPLMTYSHFGGDGYGASIVEAAFGIGMLVGSIVLMAMKNVRRFALMISVVCVAVGIVTAACGFLPPDAFPTFVALACVMAFFCAWYNSPLVTLVQRNVPDDKTGRAMGLLTAMMGLAAPIGVALGGLLAEGIGIAPFFVVDGIVCLALGVLIYLPKSVRALDSDA